MEPATVNVRKYSLKRNDINHLRSTAKTDLPGLHLADPERA
jgi:hypothetical protein